jgi:hypothetical protein
MKKITGDKPIGVIIHTYMEIPQRNTLCLYQAKTSCFSFCLFFCFSYKIKEQEGGTSPAQGEGLAPVGGGDVRERG